MAKAPKASAGTDTALVKALADILDEAGLAELDRERRAVRIVPVVRHRARPPAGRARQLAEEGPLA